MIVGLGYMFWSLEIFIRGFFLIGRMANIVEDLIDNAKNAARIRGAMGVHMNSISIYGKNEALLKGLSGYISCSVGVPVYINENRDRDWEGNYPIDFDEYRSKRV